MVGTAAATLEIQLIADVARLQQDMKAMQKAVDSATGGMGTAFKKAAQESRGYSRDVIKLKESLDPAWAAQRRATQEVELAAKAHKQGAITLEQYNQVVARAKAANDNIATSTNAQRAGMQQLSYQLSDVATMWSLGARPMQIFASQSGQVIQSLQLMSGSAKGVLGFLGGPWGIALTSAAVVMAPFIAKLFDTKEALEDVEFASNAVSDAQSILGNVIDITTGKVISQSSALHGLAKAQALVAQVQAQARLDEAKGQIQSSKGFSNAPVLGGPFRAFSFMFGPDTPAQQRQIASQFLNGVIDSEQAVEKLKELADQGRITKNTFNELAAAYANAGVEAENVKIYEKLEDALNGDTEALQGFLDIKDKSDRASKSHAETLAREAEATESLIHNLGLVADAYLESDAAALKAEVTAKAMEQGIRKRADLEAYVARQIRLKVAERTADAAADVRALRDQNDALAIVNNQVEQGLITSEQANQVLRDEKELRPYIAAQILAEGKEKKKLTEIIAELREEQARSNDETERARSLAQTEANKRQTAQLQAEIELNERLGEARISALRGLHGRPLEEELARINAEREKGLIDIRLALDIEEKLKLKKDGTTQAAIDLNKAIDGEVASLKNVAQAAKDQIDLDAKFEAEARAAQYLTDQVNALASALGGLRGIAGTIGSLIGALTSNNPQAALLGMGGLGSLAGLLLAPGALQRLGAGVSGGLQGLGLGAGLSGALGAGLVGFGAGGLVYGAGRTLGLGKGASLGAGIGAGTAVGVGALASSGALGFGATQAFLSTVGGPIGIAIAAGLGLLAGGALSPTKRGGATFGGSGANLGVSSVWGNSQSRIDTSVDLAGQVIATLRQVADALGAELGTFTGSISKRKGSLRYDPTGQGISKTSKGAIDFGQDTDALIAAAFRDAVADGVFEGLSEGFADYLKNGAGDVEQRVQDLLDVTAIQKAVEAFKDPLSAALKEFDAQAQQYKDLYAKVGASAQDTADLENYLADSRQQIIEQYSQASEDERQKRELEIQIMQLTGDEAGALAAQRQLELEALPESVRALQEHVYALQDEAAAAAQAAAVQNERVGLQIRLAETLGNEEEALALKRQLELAAIDPLNRALLESIYAAEDAARAQQLLAQAQQQAAQAAQTAASALASGGAGAVTDPLIGSAVSAIITGTSSISQAADQIKATLQTQANAAYPNDAAAAANFYNSLIAGIQTQNALNQIASGGPPVGGVDVLNYQPGNAGDPGNGGFDNHGGNGNRTFASPLDAMHAALVNAGGRQLWMQWLMGGAGSGDLPGWGGFSDGIRGMKRVLRDFGAGFAGSHALDGGRGKQLTDQGKAALSQAYERERAEIEGVIDEFSALRDTLQDFRDSLELDGLTKAQTYAELRMRLLETAGNAALGDKEAMAGLPRLGSDFLEIARRRSSTLVDYQGEIALVRGLVDDAIEAADEAVDYQEAQLDALERSVDGLIEVNEKLDTVADILRGLGRSIDGLSGEQQRSNRKVEKAGGKTAKILDANTLGGSIVQGDEVF